MKLEKRILEVINSCNAENTSNTPDYILAEYLVSCLLAFNHSVLCRDKYYDLPAPEKKELQPAITSAKQAQAAALDAPSAVAAHKPCAVSDYLENVSEIVLRGCINGDSSVKIARDIVDYLENKIKEQRTASACATRCATSRKVKEKYEN